MIVNEVSRTDSCPSQLKGGTVDLWRVSLEMDASAISLLFASLSDDEKERARRFVFAKDRQRFIVGRATLRRILAGYQRQTPGEIEFSYGPFGKPFLKDQSSGIRFNVSHSNEVGIVAVRSGGEIGVDVEFVDHSFQFSDIAHRVFSDAEVSRLEALPESLRAPAFFTGWTRKEAVLKAMGDGLSAQDELQAVIPAVSVENAISFRVSSEHGDKVLSLVSLGIDNAYKLALSVEGRLGRVRVWKFEQQADLTGGRRTLYANSVYVD